MEKVFLSMETVSMHDEVISKHHETPLKVHVSRHSSSIIEIYRIDFQGFEQQEFIFNIFAHTTENRPALKQNTNGQTRPKQQEVQAAGVKAAIV